MPFALLVGLGAGLVSALLFASASTGTLLGLLVLFFLTPLPVAIAGLGWGWASAATAAVAAPVLISALVAPRAAFFHFIALGLPTVALSYLSLLNRGVAVNGESKLEWYPVGRIVAIAALWAGVLATLALLTTATDVEGLRAALRETFDRVFVQQIEAAQPGGQTLDEAEIAAFTDLMAVSFAPAVATMWMAVAMLNLWLAGLITRASGLLVRPWPELAALALPRQAQLAFAAAIALTFLPGYAGLIASGFASAFLFAFLLVGLAILHYVTRGMGSRGLILCAVYASLVFLNPFSGLAVATIGLAEPVSPLKRKPPPSPPTII
ncbi:MAG: DUF2232 domain-containing protein [Hyphomicrobiaceae bacterium]|nr:DUF2232 domain-containing protein [Hyphomicrobiaceae bacterium]